MSEAPKFDPMAQARIDAAVPTGEEIESQLQEARYHEWVDQSVLGPNGERADGRLVPDVDSPEDLEGHPYAAEAAAERLAAVDEHGTGEGVKGPGGSAQNFVKYMESRPAAETKEEKEAANAAFDAAREKGFFDPDAVNTEAERIAGLGLVSIAQEIRTAREAGDRTKAEDLMDALMVKADAIINKAKQEAAARQGGRSEAERTRHAGGEEFSEEQINTLLERLSKLAGEHADEEELAAEIAEAEAPDLLVEEAPAARAAGKKVNSDYSDNDDTEEVAPRRREAEAPFDIEEPYANKTPEEIHQLLDNVINAAKKYKDGNTDQERELFDLAESEIDALIREMLRRDNNLNQEAFDQVKARIAQEIFGENRPSQGREAESETFDHLSDEDLEAEYLRARQAVEAAEAAEDVDALQNAQRHLNSILDEGGRRDALNRQRTQVDNRPVERLNRREQIRGTRRQRFTNKIRNGLVKAGMIGAGVAGVVGSAPGRFNRFVDTKMPESWNPRRRNVVKAVGAGILLAGAGYVAYRTFLQDDGSSNELAARRGNNGETANQLTSIHVDPGEGTSHVARDQLGIKFDSQAKWEAFNGRTNPLFKGLDGVYQDAASGEYRFKNAGNMQVPQRILDEMRRVAEEVNKAG